jgi:LAO/AO transport system kinase
MPKKEIVENWFRKRKEHRLNQTADDLFPLLIKSDRQALSSAITLIESTLSEDQEEARELLLRCQRCNQKSWRIGITGVPGVGKSTFIESFGRYFLEQGKKVAVLAIDPSSNITGGSILGDKTRMEWLSQQENVFIRPTATGTNLGGVARNTYESIILCEAAGYDIILIETVGVGQSETIVHSMVDFFLLLMLYGAGDELQGIKRGIMEMSDAIVITKADSGNEKLAEKAKIQYRNALHLFPPKKSNWIPETFTCSSLENKGLHEINSKIESYFNLIINNGWLNENRKIQEVKRLDELLYDNLVTSFFMDDNKRVEYEHLKQRVLSGELSAYHAIESFNLGRKQP